MVERWRRLYRKIFRYNVGNTNPEAQTDGSVRNSFKLVQDFRQDSFDNNCSGSVDNDRWVCKPSLPPDSQGLMIPKSEDSKGPYAPLALQPAGDNGYVICDANGIGDLDK